MNGEAQMLHDSELLKRLFADLEKSAIEAALYADFGDDRKRADFLAEARAIRSVAGKLRSLVQREQTNSGPGSVA